jgi:A/G-specific adenine glycosylase
MCEGRFGRRAAGSVPWMTASFEARLLAHARAGLRDLPWRRTRDPWAVLVSEVMLQQTQAARVRPHWHGFLQEFPTVAACAAAPQSAVVARWQGLGYNRRAVALHRTAEAVVSDHGGQFPDTEEGLRSLPGIGPYTARALLAFAFGRPVGVLDVNAGRVLARAVAGRSLALGEAQALADRLCPPGEAWLWNQAMLDLGAVWCVRREPRCLTCPVLDACRWNAAGGADPASGSAGESGPQSRFPGSHRQGRGRLVRALTRAPVERAALAVACGWPDDAAAAERAAEGLVRDGLACWEEGRLRLR